MTEKSDQRQNKCALCGKSIREQQEDKSSIISEVIDGTSYTFDKMDAYSCLRDYEVYMEQSLRIL